MIALTQIILRVLAIVGKELVEVVRKPGAIFSLVFGPFLIMAVFGLGYNGVKRPLDAIVVVPPSSGMPSDAATYQDLAGGGLRIVEVTADRTNAEARLGSSQVDVVIVVPPDPEKSFRAGEQSVIDVMIDVVDPIEEGYAGFLASGLASAVNREIIARAAAEGQDYALAAGKTDVSQIPAEVVAAPTRSELINIAPSAPGVVAFYGPAILALILQHLAITLIALSLVKERTSGKMELFRVAPVSASELLTGKVVAYGLVGAAIAGSTVILLVNAFNVPLLADPLSLAAALGALLIASLGLGLFIAVVSDSERQVVQLSLLALLASVFFSGFILSIDEFEPPVRALAYLLPVTHGMRLIGDLMLRGTSESWVWASLAAIAVVTLTASWLVLRRSMQRA